MGRARACMQTSRFYLADSLGSLWAGHARSFAPYPEAPLQNCIGPIHYGCYLSAPPPPSICFCNPSQFFHAYGFDYHLSGNSAKHPSLIHAFFFKLLPLLSIYLFLNASFSNNLSSFLTKLSFSSVPFTEFPKSENWKVSWTLPFLVHQVNH